MSPERPVIISKVAFTRMTEQLYQEFPARIMIQTTSACNLSCVFCPHPKFRDKHEQGVMSDELFRKIILEARGHGQVKDINMFLMNDPLLDPQIATRIFFAKQQVPQARIELWTNALALGRGMRRSLLASPLDHIGISIHAHRPETYQRLTGYKNFDRVKENLVAFLDEQQVYRKDIHIILRYVGSGLFLEEDERREAREFWGKYEDLEIEMPHDYISRAGNVDDAPLTPEEPRRWLAGCTDEPSQRQAHILYDGKVVLCCMDYQHKTFLGDLNDETLYEVWHGPRRQRIMETLHGLRRAPDGFLCSTCEASALPTAWNDCYPGLGDEPDGEASTPGGAEGEEAG